MACGVGNISQLILERATGLACSVGHSCETGLLDWLQQCIRACHWPAMLAMTLNSSIPLASAGKNEVLSTRGEHFEDVDVDHLKKCECKNKCRVTKEYDCTKKSTSDKMERNESLLKGII